MAKREGNFKGGRRDTAQLKYDRDVYYYSTLSIAEPITEKEARAEYSRLRSIARKRLERMEKSEFAESKTYTNNAGRFTPLPDIKSKDELYRRLSDVARFVSGKTSSVKGLKEERKKALETLREHDYSFINNKNYNAFGEFMEEWRAQKLASSYDSKQVAALFKYAEKKKIDQEVLYEKFQYFLDNRADLEQVKLKRDKEYSSADLEKEIKSLQEKREKRKKKK